MAEVCYGIYTSSMALSIKSDDDLAVHLENALARLMPAAIRAELGIVIQALAGRARRCRPIPP
ncbi:MAG: hypothetical protein ACRDOL_15785 [Streptosporangiaceae bacterium]